MNAGATVLHAVYNGLINAGSNLNILVAPCESATPSIREAPGKQSAETPAPGISAVATGKPASERSLCHFKYFRPYRATAAVLLIPKFVKKNSLQGRIFDAVLSLVF